LQCKISQEVSNAAKLEGMSINGSKGTRRLVPGLAAGSGNLSTLKPSLMTQSNRQFTGSTDWAVACAIGSA
jgi:hypothetical protein